MRNWWCFDKLLGFLLAAIFSVLNSSQVDDATSAAAWNRKKEWMKVNPTKRACAVLGCEKEAESGPLCIAHAESGRYVVCSVCNTVAEFDGLHAGGPDLGGWLVISEGPEEYCPLHRPKNMGPGAYLLRSAAR